MGLFTWPVDGLMYVFQEIADRAEAELYDEDAVKADLAALYTQVEAGTLSEEEFEPKELALVERLEDIQRRKREQSAPRPRRRARRARTPRKPRERPAVALPVALETQPPPDGGGRP